jgi:L-ribulokinase
MSAFALGIDSGNKLDRVVCAGGIAEKNSLLTQIYADAIGCATEVANSSQGCALGSAAVAAVLAGAHLSFVAAPAAMTSVRKERFFTDPTNHETYNELYRHYRVLHDSFGGLTQSADMSRVMKRLIEIKYAQRPESA